MSAFFENHELLWLPGQKRELDFFEPTRGDLAKIKFLPRWGGRVQKQVEGTGRSYPPAKVQEYISDGYVKRLPVLVEVKDELKRLNDSYSPGPAPPGGHLIGGGQLARPQGLESWIAFNYKPHVIIDDGDDFRFYRIESNLHNNAWWLQESSGDVSPITPILLWRKPVVVIGSGARD